jgi:2-phospho-L-lactate transferase
LRGVKRTPTTLAARPLERLVRRHHKHFEIRLRSAAGDHVGGQRVQRPAVALVVGIPDLLGAAVVARKQCTRDLLHQPREPGGILPFQRYFVEQRCAPRVKGFEFRGASDARPTRALREALENDSVEAVVICPSNPFISIDPILAVPGMRAALTACRAPVVAVSPIIGGRAVKGPTAKMMAELGMPASAKAVAEHYHGLLDGFVLDEADGAEAEALDLPCLATRTRMVSQDDKRTLALEGLAFARGLRKPGRPRV